MHRSCYELIYWLNIYKLVHNGTLVHATVKYDDLHMDYVPTKFSAFFLFPGELDHI